MADKFRNFWFEVYPESAPENWGEILEKTLLPFAISPVHSADAETSKPHYHVIFSHKGPITLECAKRFIPADIPANGYVEPVLHFTNAQRYLIHLDNPEKEQFPQGINSIRVLNGFPLDLTRELSPAEKREVREKCFELICEYGMSEYSEFIDSIRYLGNVDMLDYACGHTILFNSYLTSKRHAKIDDESE